MSTPRGNEKTKGLLKRFQDGETILVAEGYIFEFERRGYLRAGPFVPEVVLEHPHLVRNLYEEFVHAGSDVVQAFTYYGQRKKMDMVDREDDVEKLNRTALKMAREVADATGTLMAGNICNTTVYRPDDPEAIDRARANFQEQVEWAAEEGADFIIGETFGEVGEALLALEVIKKHGKGIPAVITLAPLAAGVTTDGVPLVEALKQVEDAGAAAVGFNCHRGPRSILPLMKEAKKVCKGPLCCLPVLYRTNDEQKSMFSLKDPDTGKMAFPVDLPAWQCSRHEVEEFGKECKDLGLQYVGLCCGNAAHYMRTLAEAFGRKPKASLYSPDMSKHAYFGTHKKLNTYILTETVKKM